MTIILIKEGKEERKSCSKSVIIRVSERMERDISRQLIRKMLMVIVLQTDADFRRFSMERT